MNNFGAFGSSNSSKVKTKISPWRSRVILIILSPLIPKPFSVRISSIAMCLSVIDTTPPSLPGILIRAFFEAKLDISI